MKTKLDEIENTDDKNCPACGKQLTNVGAFWICPEHGQVSLEKQFTPLRIFLSYGHDSNEELVRRIKTDIEKRGHDVWFDKNEIKSGHDWRRSITEGIVESHKFVSFLSKHSTRDPGVCLDEIAIAIGVKGGNIQTILVENEQEVAPPPSISHIQWLDMHDWKQRHSENEAEWEKWYQEKLAEIVTVVESDESRRFAGEIKTLEEKLKPLSSDSRIFQLLKKGVTGRAWLDEAIDEWRGGNENHSRLFWITGAPGVGKSAYAARLSHYGKDRVLAIHFCQYDKPDHRNAHCIVRTLAFQIATRLPDFRKLLMGLPVLSKLDEKTSDQLFNDLLASPLSNAIHGGRDRYLIVIDALDEVSCNGRNELVEMLARNATSLPNWIGIVVTSRPENEVIAPLQGLNPFALDTATESNRVDILDFLRNQLSEQLRNHHNANDLIEKIFERSEGVFLYAERFCDGVQRGDISLDRPDQFPQGLGGIYFQYFQRQFPDLENFRKDIRPVLRVILAAREPLPVEIIRQLFNWQDEELHDFSLTLGSLFPITKESKGEVIKSYHKSLADWLADEGKAGTYFVSVLEGYRILAEAGLNEFHTNKRLSPYFKNNLLYHLFDTNNWYSIQHLLGEDDFLIESSGSIRQCVPALLRSAASNCSSVEKLLLVPERYVQICRNLQKSEYIPWKLIPGPALDSIMHRADGKRRYKEEFIETVIQIFIFYSRALEIALAIAPDTRYGATRFQSLLADSEDFLHMADAVWDRDLYEISGKLANLYWIITGFWKEGREFLKQKGVFLAPIKLKNSSL